jgi:hypothetical protein
MHKGEKAGSRVPQTVVGVKNGSFSFIQVDIDEGEDRAPEPLL